MTTDRGRTTRVGMDRQRNYWLELVCAHSTGTRKILVRQYQLLKSCQIAQSMHNQQLLRWGQEPLPPPRLTYQEYEEVCGWIRFHSNSKALGRHEASLFIAATYDAIFIFWTRTNNLLGSVYGSHHEIRRQRRVYSHTFGLGGLDFISGARNQ